jgi:hypothetical protein
MAQLGRPRNTSPFKPYALEQCTYLAIVVFMVAAQVMGLWLRVSAPDRLQLPVSGPLFSRFGFDQLGHLGIGLSLTAYALLAALVLGLHRHGVAARAWCRRLGELATSPVGAVLLSLVSVGVFYALRNEFVNPDGRAFSMRFIADRYVRGAHVTHDEMWELYIHSRFWYWANARYGWSVVESYQLLSCLAGGVFVFLLTRTCALLAPRWPAVLIACVASGGFMQLFFGDVENYSMTAALILLFLLCALLHAKGRLSIIGPSLALGVAISFHLLAGFLLPSLGYLYWRNVRTRGWRSTLVGASVLVGVVALTLWFFDSHGLPLEDLYYKSHAFGHGGHILLMLSRLSWTYYWQQLNLLALLFPASIVILPLLAFGRIIRDDANVFLAIATVFLLVLQFGWKAQLGVYYDWNLYAAAAIPFSLLVWSNLLTHLRLPLKAEVIACLAGLSGLHSMAWIVSNRFYGFL